MSRIVLVAKPDGPLQEAVTPVVPPSQQGCQGPVEKPGEPPLLTAGPPYPLQPEEKPEPVKAPPRAAAPSVVKK